MIHWALTARRILRKLITQLYSNVQTLEWELNRIHGNKETETGEKQDAAR
ncbi:hypothetical protein GCM10017744_000860 [Streptomyces antimycoticus]|uniref:Uncharacterized protein n=1 Tax=Streptomyces antimycoticus TaxID=68175 RepID=A0A4D4KRC8_9ACTN|nr:hypothetical protein [Streptomyces antimycoticus]GDY48998.1 hypothetical protein SANT12839_098800 [Streptomyces antimycoticus]